MISVIIRVLNEAKHLDALLTGIKEQNTGGIPVETVIVDSGSTDGTLDIASHHGCRISHIKKEDFSFGRSLNIGCKAARGDFLAFVSGHCVPFNDEWLSRLIAPLERCEGVYSYGRQIGNHLNKFSESQIFAKYFPEEPELAQKGFFCNNANSAITRDTWAAHRFDEQLTGLEDMELAKRLITEGDKVVYAPNSIVYHIHEESWGQVKRRYEREAIALQHIMPEVHVHFGDFLRYFFSAVLHDCGEARRRKTLSKAFSEILAFRFMQYWGTYRGNQIHREVSRERKEKYFYPKTDPQTVSNLTVSKRKMNDQGAKDRGSFAA